MVPQILGRAAEAQAIADFLALAATQPTGLLVEGEAGIGKTTIWLAAVDAAQQEGFQVLSARPAEAESVLGYAALADLLSDVEADVGAWAELPTPQRLALDRVALRVGADDGVTNPRAVAAGFVTLIGCMAQTRPVLLAIDDLQWLDSSSVQVVAFAARRLAGRAGFVGTVRTGVDSSSEISWLQLPRSAEIRRIELGALSLGGLQAVITKRHGQSVPRAAMVRIHEVSQGNPFYALELARVVDEAEGSIGMRLPRSLAETVRGRIARIHSDVRGVLLAASCVPAPTVELIARAIDQEPEQVVGLLAHAEDNGIAFLDGHRISFAHPLLARGIYSEATGAQRRQMHRAIAEVVDEPELQARHLAMSVAWGDARTLECLDRAADTAVARGAPAAAAELLDLAVGIGGDTAERRIRLAGHHFAAGDCARAKELLEETIAALTPGRLRAEALSVLGPVRIWGDSFHEGVAALERALEEADGDLALRLPTLVTMMLPLFNTGQLAEAARRAEGAVEDATRLGQPYLLCQALGLRTVFNFLCGNGVDEDGLRSALEMEDRCTDAAAGSSFHMMVRPRSQYALLLGWTGQLERAHQEMAALRHECEEHGLENMWMYHTYYSVQVEIWRGDFGEAAALAEQGMERAHLSGSVVSLGAALTWRAALAAYAGNEQQARSDAAEAIAAMRRCDAHMLTGWPIAITGFLDVSLGNHGAALDVLQPLLSDLDAAPGGTEIYLAEFVPDAVEAFVHLGRPAEAEPLVGRLQRNGRRLDRAWMLAVGGRCRSMLQAAGGDLEAAAASAREAMKQHARLPMPFEEARTRLVLGQLERRLRHREAALTALRQALATFERLDTPLWARRAEAELARTDVSGARAGGLTVSEQRVAELAASGMTNRDVAAALFISPKTVEANLVRIYRKLGIHSRAELGKAIGVSDAPLGSSSDRG